MATQTRLAPAAAKAPATPGARGSRSPVAAVLAIIGALALGYLFRGLAVPLLLAAVLAYFLHPLVWWAKTFAIRRSVAVVALYLAIGIVLVFLWRLAGGRLSTEVTAMAAGLPSVTQRLEEALTRAVQDLGEAHPSLRRFLPKAATQVGWLEAALLGRLGDPSHLLEHAGTIFLFMVLVPMFSFFLLRDSDRLTAFLMDRLPPAHIETSVALWCEIERIIGRYLRGIALDGIAFGALAALGLWALGVRYPLVLGGFAGLANTVPIIGPVLGGTAGGLVALLTTQSFEAVGWVVLLFVGLKLLDDSVLQPLTIGQSLHLHPLLLVASVVAAQQALGILGMVVAVPAVTVLQEVLRLLMEHHDTLTGTHRPKGVQSTRVPPVLC
jgi:predicted PurR-regulated permease PerM